MYQNIYFDKTTNTCHLFDDKKGYKSFVFRPYAYRKRNGGKYRSIFGDELEKVYSFNPRDTSLFESDVPIDTRILIDAYEDSDDVSDNHRILFLDIEVSTEGGYPNNEEADKEITAIAIYDSVLKKYTAFVLDNNNLIENFDSVEKEIVSFRDEASMLNAFLTKWEEIQPTIVTGWNSDQFDMPYIYRRLKNITGSKNAKRLSPIGVTYINDWNQKLIIAGVTHLDYMKVYEKMMIKKEPSYSLNSIGKKQVGMEKITYRGSLDTLYREDIKKYVEYNLNDVEIMVAIDNKLKLIDLVRAICHKGHVPYECYDRSSRFIEGAILMYLRRNNQVAKNKPIGGREQYANQQDSDEQGFEGAYVKEPVPGRYEWVFDLDLTSMYPNIVISLNISPETKVAVVDRIEYDQQHIHDRTRELTDDWENLSDKAKHETSLTQYIDQKLYTYNARMFAQNKISKYYLGSVSYTHQEFKELLKQNELSISSNGVLYRKDIPGVLPNILVKWFDERKQMRNLAKEYAKEKNWELYEFYEQRQKVQKVLLNSIYGVLGLPIFRFYDKDNASAVTITGQDIIKTTGKAINEYFKKTLNVTDGNYVIYTDTDSVGPDSIVKTNLYDKIKISDLFDKLELDSNNQHMVDLFGKNFVFPMTLKMPYFDEKNQIIKYGNVQYVERHRVKKVAYQIKTKTGKCITVTSDHSIMVLQNGVLVEKKPNELKSSDKIISISD
jgi:DNA polymerase elongation subunit (family B)